MKKTANIGPIPSSQETVNGFVYLAFQVTLLPSMLQWFNTQLGIGLNDAELNFVYYLINFISMLLLFHSFLGRNLRQVTQNPFEVCQAVILGLVAYYAFFWLTEYLVGLLVPGFSNYNDEAIIAMEGSNSFLMLIGVVVLAPPVEECFFRGLIFRNLYGRNRWMAYAVSILAFAMIHILGYIGQYSPLELTMAVLQYLPAGIWLAWCYTKADTIFAPILVHAAINYFAFRTLR